MNITNAERKGYEAQTWKHLMRYLNKRAMCLNKLRQEAVDTYYELAADDEADVIDTIMAKERIDDLEAKYRAYMRVSDMIAEHIEVLEEDLPF